MGKVGDAIGRYVMKKVAGKPEGVVRRSDSYKIDKKGRRIWELKGFQKMFAMMSRASTGKNVPLIIISQEIDVTELDTYRKKLKEEGHSISYNTLLIKALALAVEEYPILSSVWLNKYKLWLPSPGHINIAGPVQAGDIAYLYYVEDVSVKPLKKINEEIKDQVDRIFNKESSPYDCYSHIIDKKPLLTASNPGTAGKLLLVSTNYYLPPYVGSVSINTIQDKPGVVNGKVVPRKIVVLTVLSDHCVCEANTPLEFLDKVQELVNNPEKMGPIE